MHKLLVQFHATPHELAEFLSDVMRAGFIVVIMNRTPFSIQIATEADLDPERINAATQIGIVKEQLRAVPENWESFLDDHKEALFLTVGRLENQVLAQSWLLAQSTSEAEIKRWQRVANLLKKRTTAGIWVTNPTTKAGGFYKNFRFTEGALALYDKGCRMAPPAGTNLVHLREPHSDLQQRSPQA